MPEPLSIDLDVIHVGVDLVLGKQNGGTIHGDTASDNQLFAGSARGDAGGCQNFTQSISGHTIRSSLITMTTSLTSAKILILKFAFC